MLRKIGIIAVLSLMALAIAAVPALAAKPATTGNPHFIGTPTATDQGTTLQVTGSIAGLGNENVDVLLTAEGTATVTCSNPGQNTDVPGQRANITATGTATNVEVDNGRANFTITSAAPTTSGPNVNGVKVCPNRQWTATVTGVDFTGYNITVFQPATMPPFGGTIVLDEDFSL